MQDFHRRSNLPVHEALAEVVPKVEFGSQVMLALIWLQQFHRCSGLPVQTEQKACLQKVYMDQDALQRELAESKKKRERANDLALAYAAASTANPLERLKCSSSLRSLLGSIVVHEIGIAAGKGPCPSIKQVMLPQQTQTHPPAHLWGSQEIDNANATTTFQLTRVYVCSPCLLLSETESMEQSSHFL